MFRLVVPVAASLVPVVEVPPWWLVCLDHSGRAVAYTGDTSGGYARQLLSAAGNLASESKLQGEINRCDYSYCQLFRCSFRVRFCITVYRLKH